MSIEQTLTDDEKLAELDLEQLQQLVGLVDYDASRDPFPVSGWDALVWVVGNATQTAHYFQTAFGMELVAYSGPETGNRDHHAYVLTAARPGSSSPAPYDPASPLADHHRRHGDGVVDIALEVPDVDRCIAHARAPGRDVLVEPHDVTDEHGTVRIGGDRHLRRHPAHPGRPVPLHRALPARLRRPRRRPSCSGPARRSGCSRRSTTWSATSSWAGWTSGWPSTTGSWASPTWPSSSATTSPPSTRR